MVEREIQQKMESQKEAEFLRYLVRKSREEPNGLLNIGEIGDELGLPYEEAIRLADELREEGYLLRVGRFNAPRGPGVRITPGGMRAAAA